MSRGKSKARNGKGPSRKETQAATPTATDKEKVTTADDAEGGPGEIVDSDIIEAEVVRPVIVEPAVVRPQVVDAEVVQPIVIRPRSADEITVVVANPRSAGSAEAFLAHGERTPPPQLVDDMEDYLAEFEDAPTLPDTTPRWAQVSGR